MKKKENILEQYKTLLGAYYGISSMDLYDLKVYLLKDLENIINDFIKDNNLDRVDLLKLNDEVLKLPLKRKLQDSLLVLYKINGPMDFIFMIKDRLREIDK